MQVLFVVYHNFIANSAIQVHHFANSLSELGVDTFIFVPNEKETCHSHINGEIKYTPLNYNEFKQALGTLIKTDKKTIIHAWTPREIVRKQVEKMQLQMANAKIVVDLEDNEEQILATNLGASFEVLSALPHKELARKIPNNLSHPINYKTFLKNADGVTVIMDTLFEFVPPDTPKLVLWPILDTNRFFPRAKDETYKRKLGIKEEQIVLSYVGNVHSANWKEVRSLYLSIALANREGIPAILVRAGKDHYPFWGEHHNWAYDYSIELGTVPNSQIPAILAISDLLVQPGKADKFNNYRLPSKLPEFLAMEIPVAMPKTNLGRFLVHEKEAILFNKGDALEILELIKRRYSGDSSLDEIAKNGREFVVSYFKRERIGKKLLEFYEAILD